ncbi:F-box/FBD/LRR-repeat protein At1g13570-like [Bidens hawaiensis]|uniref:F-box/FBD/LRR-repeat protein At1g13570-like n=1 Tax=Bidens hawaiensis TaxID=980011 RepID=UPI00404A95E7
MELVHRKRKESKFAPQDFISNMPDNVVTNILDRLPIQDAVRTGILARKWRFKWNMVSQLVLNDDFCEFLSKTKGNINKYWIIINSLLFHLNGAITKFVLRGKLDDGNISLWILFLSRKGIKDLSLVHDGITPFKLPTHLFSCLELKHLKLANCCFNPPPTFRGFPNLLSFEFSGESRELGEFIIQCPLLEILKLLSSGNVKLVEIAELKKLKLLYLQLCNLYTTTIISSYNIFDLLGSLPKLQELRLDFTDYKLTECGAKKKCSTAFPSLNALRLSRIDLGDGMNLSCALELIKSSPNLHTLGILAIQSDADPIPIPEVEYKTTTLRSVLFTCFAGTENEVYLIKYLLACSPSLKRFYICPRDHLPPTERLMFTTKLLKLPRASTVAEIYFDYPLSRLK